MVMVRDTILPQATTCTDRVKFNRYRYISGSPVRQFHDICLYPLPLSLFTYRVSLMLLE